jgi:hypothetical protein
MHKLKGQWYLIAGILISFTLVSFFYIYYSYSTIDFTSVLKNREDDFALNMVSVLNETKLNSPINENRLADFGELLDLLKGSLEEKGYLIKYNYNSSNVNLTIAGDKMKVKIY